MGNRISELSGPVIDEPKSSAPAWLGKRVGRFRLVSELGRGSMGRVFRAEDTLLQRQVALKVLPRMVRRGEKKVDASRLIAEARAAATLDHPNVVTVYEVNESGGVYYIAMELLGGGSLRDIVKAAGPMDCARACLMCADAADALAQAHASGIIHRDIKPANLLLTRNGRCKVADFGLARVDDAGDLSPNLPASVGTPQFIAPELLRGIHASPQSDIYSLGATLWFLLTGHPPFEARTAAELLRHHLESPLPDLSGVRPDLPAGLLQAIGKAMAKRPADRFTSVTQFEKVLRVYTIATESGVPSQLGELMDVTEPEQPAVAAAIPAGGILWAPGAVFAGAAGAAALLLAVALFAVLRWTHPGRTSAAEAPIAASANQAQDRQPSSPAAGATGDAAPSPVDAKIYAARGFEAARRGQFSDAAAQYAAASQLDPAAVTPWYYRACLTAYLGDENAYRSTCKGLFERFSASKDATQRDKTAKTCAILPGSGIDPKDLLALSDSLPSDGLGNQELVAWFHFCKGMALYRSGQYSQCVETMAKATTPDRAARAPAAQLFAAMSQWKMGMRADAQATLHQATDRMDHSLSKAGVDDVTRDGLEDWLICQTIRREAEKLIVSGH